MALMSWSSQVLCSHGRASASPPTLGRPGQAEPSNPYITAASPTPQLPLHIGPHRRPPLLPSPTDTSLLRISNSPVLCASNKTHSYYNKLAPSLGTNIVLSQNQPCRATPLSPTPTALLPDTQRYLRPRQSSKSLTLFTTEPPLLQTTHSTQCLSTGLTNSASRATSKPTAPHTAPNPAAWPTTRRHHQHLVPDRAHPDLVRHPTSGPSPGLQPRARSSTFRQPSTSAARN